MRLKSIPYYLEVANKTDRVFFIKWEKFHLEDFVLPAEGGLDWRLPDRYEIGKEPDLISRDIEQILNDENHPLNSKRNLIVRPNVAMLNRESLRSEQKPIESGSYSNIMSILFVPVPPLAVQIRKTMQSLNIRRKKYISAHYRVSSDNYVEVNDKTKKEAHRAIECAVHAAGDNKDLPIYFASSQTQYVKYILNDSPFSQSKKSPVKVIGLDNTTRLHSDKSALGYSDPATLYPAFVDLWLMKYSKCVSYGHLGFGKLGAYLSGEDCTFHHINWRVKCPSLV